VSKLQKFSIELVQNSLEWDKLVNISNQSTIFHHSVFLNSLDANIKKLIVQKNLRTVACVIVNLDNNNNINNEFLIHNGFFFIENANQSIVSIQLERINICNFILEYFSEKFNKCSFTLSPFFDDLRPFVWFKKHKNDLTIDIRHTLYLDVSELKNIDVISNSNFYKNMQRSRRRQIKEYQNDKCSYEISKNTDTLLDFYKNNFNQQNIEVSPAKLKQIKTIMQNLIISKNGFVLNILNKHENIIYSIFFAHDQRRAYALFASGSKENENSYAGTMAYIQSFIYIASHLNLNEVDIEGINSVKGGQFKLGFGGRIKQYVKISF
jgi:hypothetical protein